VHALFAHLIFILLNYSWLIRLDKEINDWTNGQTNEWTNRKIKKTKRWTDEEMDY
jgi:hypothetical protein